MANMYANDLDTIVVVRSIITDQRRAQLLMLPQDEDHDGDSALGDDVLSDTTSIASSITKYRYENGRRYHKYQEGAYWGPNDEAQNNQLDIGSVWLAPANAGFF